MLQDILQPWQKADDVRSIGDGAEATEEEPMEEDHIETLDIEPTEEDRMEFSDIETIEEEHGEHQELPEIPFNTWDILADDVRSPAVDSEAMEWEGHKDFLDMLEVTEKDCTGIADIEATEGERGEHGELPESLGAPHNTVDISVDPSQLGYDFLGQTTTF